MEKIKHIRQLISNCFLKAIGPFAKLLASLKVHPHVLTVGGVVISLVAANFYRLGLFAYAGLMVLLAGICDVLDGQLARETNKMSKYGALIDSTLDRYSEVFIFLGLAAYYHKSNSYLPLVIMIAIAGSMLVSYTRARAEGLGIQCKIGIMQRQERIVALVVGTFLAAIPHIGNYFMIFTIWFIAVMTNITVIQRIIYVRKELKGLNNGLASNS
jgi:CDP-diacylglycerol---glycerol-3-phosphate 3-phosphatidyltransferase